MNKMGIMSKNETIYIALVLVKDRMVQTNCRYVTETQYTTLFLKCQVIPQSSGEI